MLLTVSILVPVCCSGQYFDTAADRVVKLFRVDPARGLSQDMVLKRREQYGDNSLPPPPHVPVWKMLLRQLTDFIVLILIAAAIISFAIDEAKSGTIANSVCISSMLVIVCEFVAPLL